jgi:hypothetical protein
MDEFGYLSVLISIILGFAMTEALKGLATVIRHRDRVKPYWPAVVWALFSLIVDVQVWWACFDLRHQTRWSFAAFGVVLLQTVLLYLFAALVLPDPGEVDEHGGADLKANYLAHRRWLFSAFLALLAVSLIKNLVVYQHLPRPEDLAFHGVFAALCLIGILSARDVVHKALAVIGMVGIALYIGLLFGALH